MIYLVLNTQKKSILMLDLFVAVSKSKNVELLKIIPLKQTIISQNMLIQMFYKRIIQTMSMTHHVLARIHAYPCGNR